MKFFSATLFLIMLPLLLNAQEKSWVWQNPSPQGNNLYSSFAINERVIFGGMAGTIIYTNSENDFYSYNIDLFENLLVQKIYFTSNEVGYISGKIIGAPSGENRFILKTKNSGESWEVVQSGLSSSDISDLEFTDNGTGWFVTTTGLLYKSDIDGENWNFHTDLSDASDIYFTNDQDGWIAGGSFVYKTNNGGDSWEVIITDNSYNFEGIEFIDNNIGLIYTPNGLLKTMNNGESWDFFEIDQNNSVKSVRFFNENNGIAAGSSSNGRTFVYITNDGGETWNSVSDEDFDIYQRDYIRELIINGSESWIIGDKGTILYSSDLGQTWERVSQKIEDNYITDICFINSTTGLLSTSSGKIYKTEDSGDTWYVLYEGGTNSIDELVSIDENNLYAAGVNGNIVKTINGGTNWSNLSFDDGNGIRSMSFVDVNHGWVVTRNKIFKTEDAGESWSQISTGESSYLAEYESVHFLSKDRGWITGIGDGGVIRTVDGGVNWEFTEVPGLFYEVTFSNEEKGWIVGQGGQNAVLYSTTDGGVSWSKTETGTVQGSFDEIHVSDNNDSIIWLLNNGHSSLAVYKSNDGGETWIREVLPISEISDLNMSIVDSENAWIAGEGAVLTYKENPFPVNSENQVDIPLTSELEQNYPNPFNPTTTISYLLKETGFVSLEVFDMLGRRVSVLVNSVQIGGDYSVTFEGDGLSTGIYIYRLTTDKGVFTKKMTLIK